jgi:hypothetical protein
MCFILPPLEQRTRRGVPSNRVQVEDATHLVGTRPLEVEVPVLELDECAVLLSAIEITLTTISPTKGRSSALP